MNKKCSTMFLCCAIALGAQAADGTAKTDVLGRHVSSTQKVPKAYLKDIKKTTEQKAVIKTAGPQQQKALALTHYVNPPMITTSGVFEYKKNSSGNFEKLYKLNGNTVSETQYKNQIKQIEDADVPRLQYAQANPGNYPTGTNYQFATFATTDECSGQSSCTVNLETYSYYNQSGSHFVTREDINFWNYSSVLSNSNLNQYGAWSGYDGQKIGIQFTDIDAPQENVISNGHLQVMGDCSNNHYANGVIHTSKVARVLNKVAPGAMLYAFSTNCNNYTNNLVLESASYWKNPQVFIGSNSYGQALPKYSDESMYMDDYIYDTRTIEFASIGNDGLSNGSQATGLGMAVNAISVGAVHNDMTYHQTSSWRNPRFSKKNDASYTGSSYVKPEIANFADILVPSEKSLVIMNQRILESYFTQTSSATPYTAASVALLLQKFPFYKWHPEVVKALLITSSIKPITNASSHDSDNEGKYAMGVPEGRAMFENNRSRFWNGNNEDFFDNNGDIRFTESNIKKNKRYRIAISWLSSGTYVRENGKLPQDIDLRVYQNGNLLDYSTSGPNPFELVEFTTNSQSDLTIEIHRYRNDGGRVLIGYNLLEVQ